MDYQIAHNINELRKKAEEGYRFIAVLTPSDWLVAKVDYPNLRAAESTFSTVTMPLGSVETMGTISEDENEFGSDKENAW